MQGLNFFSLFRFVDNIDKILMIIGGNWFCYHGINCFNIDINSEPDSGFIQWSYQILLNIKGSSCEDYYNLNRNFTCWNDTEHMLEHFCWSTGSEMSQGIFSKHIESINRLVWHSWPELNNYIFQPWHPYFWTSDWRENFNYRLSVFCSDYLCDTMPLLWMDLYVGHFGLSIIDGYGIH